jgi:hypothetical protein
MLAGTKIPAVRWKPLRDRRPALGTIVRWVKSLEVAAIAAIHGKPSGFLANRDFDRAAAYRAWKKAHPDLAAVLPTMRTSRGFGVWFRTAGESFHILGDGEFRADCKHYSLLPPSAHPDGITYSWVVPPGNGFPLIEDPVTAGLLPPLTPPAREDSLRMCVNTSCESLPTTEVVFSGEVETAIRGTLPTGPGQRHHALFEFARRLRGLPALAGLKADDLAEVVRSWWRRALPVIRTQEWGPTWSDWRDAWRDVRFPAGCELDALGARVRCVADDPLTQVSLLAEALQAQTGDKCFFLGSRAAARALGISQSTASRALRRLVACGELELVEPGMYSTGMASEYRRAGTGVLRQKGGCCG